MCVTSIAGLSWRRWSVGFIFIHVPPRTTLGPMVSAYFHGQGPVPPVTPHLPSLPASSAREAGVQTVSPGCTASAGP